MGKNNAFKFRIYPTKKEKEIMGEFFRTNKFIYNHLLAIEENTNFILRMYGLNNDTPNKELNKWKSKHSLWFNRFMASKYLTKLKDSGKYPFLSSFPSNARDTVIKDLYEAFEKMKKGSGYPKFKNRKSNDSYRVRYTNNMILNITKFGNKFHKINLPSNIKKPLKNITIVIHNQYFLDNYTNFKFNSVTISKNKSGQYFVSFQIQENIEKPEQKDINEETSIGIDLGIAKTITLSNGETLKSKENKINSYREHEADLKRLQKIISGKKKGSNKYNRILNKIRKLHTKISNIRKDIHHNLTHELVNLENIDTFVLEDLNVKGMSKKAKPKQSENGGYLPNGKKRKSGLNKSLLDVGLHSIKEKLIYKAKNLGKNVVLVDPKYTSQKCNNCGHTSKENRKTQKSFICIACGHTENADLNASKNIKDKFFEKT